ncbi:hypothetical protein CARUB_v10021657mg [Capsella rubella]|uniref:HMA domain-containing protein n=1 Tax=Capsella rubella TaxID=81985 RepID=R0I7T5_9BRAS|nr:hypothetical protein CARUB_v10021657mg [Capsella rubella]
MLGCWLKQSHGNTTTIGCWLKKSRENIEDNVIVTDVELKILMNFEDCAKKIRKVACQVDGVKSCITYVDDEKVIISGEFNLHKLLKTLKKKTGKKIEVVMKTEKLVVVHDKEDDEPETMESDVVHKEDDEPETETPEVVQNQDNKDEIVPQNDDKLETSMMEVEFDIPLLYEEYEKYFEKVISKFEGVETYGTDVENKKIVVIGNFDKDRLLKKLDKKSARLNRKIQQAEMIFEEEHKIIQEFCENLDKEAEERKIIEEFCENLDMEAEERKIIEEFCENLDKEAEEHKIIEEFCENLDKEAEERKIMAEFCEEIDNVIMKRRWPKYYYMFSDKNADACSNS